MVVRVAEMDLTLAERDLGEQPVERPVHFQEVFATMYGALGLNIDHLTLNDLQGRPRYLVDQNVHRPMPELV